MRKQLILGIVAAVSIAAGQFAVAAGAVAKPAPRVEIKSFSDIDLQKQVEAKVKALGLKSADASISEIVQALKNKGEVVGTLQKVALERSILKTSEGEINLARLLLRTLAIREVLKSAAQNQASIALGKLVSNSLDLITMEPVLATEVIGGKPSDVEGRGHTAYLTTVKLAADVIEKGELDATKMDTVTMMLQSFKTEKQNNPEMSLRNAWFNAGKSLHESLKTEKDDAKITKIKRLLEELFGCKA